MNPWERLPLLVYENHMRSDGVKQLQTLNGIMREQFQSYKISSTAIFGVTGGNGLEHTVTAGFEKIFGIDISAEYLSVCRERFGDMGGRLTLLNRDLSDPDCALPRAELIIADLVIEYIGICAFVSHARKCGAEFISCVIQKNNGADFVSSSPFISEFDGVSALHRDIEAEKLTEAMYNDGFFPRPALEYGLPNGKALLRLDFVRGEFR